MVSFARVIGSVNRQVPVNSQNLLWILVVESKNMGASEYVGIAQMLSYAYTSLARQESVWGIVTNGANYQFSIFAVEKIRRINGC